MEGTNNRKWIWWVVGIVVLLLCIAILFIFYGQLTMGPTYQVVDVKMVSCRVVATQYCSAPGVATFSPIDSKDVCIAWVEVGRHKMDSLTLRVYDKSGRTVFSYDEPQDASTLQDRECRSLPVGTVTAVGEYSSVFILSGRPSGSPVLWSIK